MTVNWLPGVLVVCPASLLDSIHRETRQEQFRVLESLTTDSGSGLLSCVIRCVLRINMLRLITAWLWEGTG